MSFRSNYCLNLPHHSFSSPPPPPPPPPSRCCFLPNRRKRNLVVSFLQLGGEPSCYHHQISGFRVWRRPRLKKIERKLSSSVVVVVSSNNHTNYNNNELLLLLGPFDDLFKNLLISQFPPPPPVVLNSSLLLDLIAPALGLASGLLLYLAAANTTSTPTNTTANSDHRNNHNHNFEEEGEEEEEEEEPSDTTSTTTGEWILFTSPTPFNRFVMLRCPSILFQGDGGGGELLLQEEEDVNEKLVKEERHYVRIQPPAAKGSNFEQKKKKLVYQRVCVSTDDGGVISLDWPANLNMTEDRGLDTTVLLIPGTTEGSMDKDVQSFVCETVKRGCFPIVMNPRGCADSPLTTPRLFTAADSNDVSTALQYIIKERPWTTLMGIGWGYGANMLTKYLAEVGERTPLTAAACVDNPFDLEEVARSAIHHVHVDQKLTSGLIHILKSNKELFQGKAKGFNVEKALSATSVRDFEKAISMISYGFETIEEFYAASSTRELVGNVKIPLLFIQTDNETVPSFSIPRSSISENPFTSLLLCSYLPSRIIIRGRSALSWCQGIVIEWLTAVELALLKGRHPLLKDVDVTINPSKGLSLVEGRESDKRKKANKILDFAQSSALDRYDVFPVKDSTLEESDRVDSVHLRSRKSSESRKEENNDVSEESNTVEARLVKEEGDNTAVNEESQVLLSAQTIMNMLDVTMPGTLSEKQKQKVLTAMGQGETLMMALEGAVPEDVRGKLTTAVTEIVQTQGTNLNFGNIMRVGRIPNESPVVKIQETLGEPSPAADGNNNGHSLDQMKKDDGLSDGTDKNKTDIEKPADVKNQTLDLGHSQSNCIPVEDNSSSKMNMESDKNNGNGELSEDTAAKSSEHAEAKTGGSSSSEKAAEPQDFVVDEQVSINNTAETQISKKSSKDNQTSKGKNMEDSTVQSNPIPTTETEEAIVTPSSEPQSMEKEGNSIEKSDDKNVQSMENQNSLSSPQSEESTPSNPPASNPSISVSQAFSALGGFDDSTQIAVTSVFGVLENIITQFEEGIEKQNDGEQDKLHDEEHGSASEESPISVEPEKKSGKKDQKEDTKSELILESQASDTEYKSEENQLTPNCTSSLKNSSSRGNNISNVDKDGRKSKDLIDPRILALDSDKVGQLHKMPLCATVNPYGDSLYSEYLRKYLLAKMSSSKPLDLDSTTDLLLDYFPEEGQWKFLDQPGNNSDSVSNIRIQKDVSGKDRVIPSPLQAKDTDRFIETSYVILDTENEQQPLKNYKIVDGLIKKLEEGSPRTEELICLLKYIVLDSLKVEVGRRLGLPDVKEMESNLADDLEEVADAVSLGVGHNQDLIWSVKKKDPSSRKVGTLHGEHMINIISSAVQNTRFLRKVLPVGVVVGSTLASLRKYFIVATEHDEFPKIETILDQASNAEEKFFDEGNIRSDHQLAHKDPQSDSDSLNNGGSEKTETGFLNRNTAMVGAVTAALGASAFLAHEQTEPFRNNEASEVSSMSLGETVNHDKEHNKLEDVMSENNHSAVSSLAEKAMAVAGPVVPTKGDGAVDQDRLVAMLAELGQKGGILQLVGKVALLWGGLRGAMSLTEKLISFLRLAERPLFQRILGFVGMVLVMWSPVVIPLFPSLVQSWSARKSTGFALYACIFGLYLAVIILIMLWGKRIRGYEQPLKQYGLDLASLPKIYELTKGLIGGVMLVLSIHSINALLGYTSLVWPSHLKSSPDAAIWLKVYGGMLTMAGQGIVTAIVVSTVEELVFRSWLLEEIAADFGYNRAVIISGLAFAILQRSLWAMPGFWLVSIALSGARQRNKGSLSIPIGMRSGILASCYILQTGGFLVYHPRNPIWMTGTQPLQPFSGAVGLAASLTVAALLYERRQEPLGMKKTTSAITE